MSIPYYQSVHHHPSSRVSPEYDLTWSETAMQAHSKIGWHQSSEHPNYNQFSEINSAHLQTPANHSSNVFSPVSPLYASANHMLATPSTTFDAMDHFPTPELLMGPDFAKARNLSYCDVLSIYEDIPESHSHNHLLSNTYETSVYTQNYVQHNTALDVPFTEELDSSGSQQHTPRINAGSNRAYHDSVSNFTPIFPSSRRMVSAENTRQDPDHRMVFDSMNEESPLLIGDTLLAQNTSFSIGVPEPAIFNDFIADSSFINLNEDKSWNFVRADGHDDDISQLLEMEESRSNNEIIRRECQMTVNTNMTSHSSPAKKASRSPASTNLGESPRTRRSHNSSNYNYPDNENSAGPMFSLEDCSNEFRVSEGNFAFQDETAEVLKRHSISSLQKKRSISKMSKASTKPLLRKAKTAPNLGRQLSKNSINMLKNMESGLLSFQIPQKK